ncbi:Zinc finger BED domain-containing protein 4 [Labeo rohita]|uniref:Zinc finger BED domain-containing protein 4 n=1 Tax=Labeo rohita TaxID=84645 RepID=A0ABQ8M8P8_LABRO|nr:Zinc finger BED domain-containing protein 4 [Labeo rohita]
MSTMLSAEMTSQVIPGIYNNWEIHLKKVHVILRDNASNMKAAMEDMAVPSLGCFAHTLQLVVHEGLMSQRSVSDALANSRKIVAHFKHSQLAQSRLEDLQREMQGARTTTTPARLVQDVQTRWNSSFYMIKSLLTEKRPLCAYAADHNLPATLSANEWGLLEKTVTVLEPFKELTRKISSATSTAADVIPAVTVLKRLLAEENSTDSGIKTMKSTLLQAVSRRFSSIESESLYAVATLLDARYKDRFFSGGETARRMAKDLLKQELDKMEQAQLKASAEGQGGTKEAEPAENQVLLQAQVRVASAVYITEFWRNMMNLLKVPRQQLSKCKLKFLSAPSTSVESERLFSTASNIVDEKRNRLTAERAEMLIFLKKNLPMFKGRITEPEEEKGRWRDAGRTEAGTAQ